MKLITAMTLAALTCLVLGCNLDPELSEAIADVKTAAPKVCKNWCEQATTCYWNTLTTDYNYDYGNRLTGMTLPNGIEAGYGYDDTNRLLDISYLKDQEVLRQYRYTYDDAGNPLQIDEYSQASGQHMDSMRVTVADSASNMMVGYTVHALQDGMETGFTES